MRFVQDTMQARNLGTIVNTILDDIAKHNSFDTAQSVAQNFTGLRASEGENYCIIDVGSKYKSIFNLLAKISNQVVSYKNIFGDEFEKPVWVRNPDDIYMDTIYKYFVMFKTLTTTEIYVDSAVEVGNARLPMA